MSLQIIRQIVPENCMRTDGIVRLFAALQGSVPDSEPQALLVGGCVRNILLGKEVDDIDIATPLLPDEVTEILTAADIKVIPTGLDHGTVTAIADGEKFEITTLRHDKETDGRRAVVSFTDSWVEDAKRRDFTMNTLLMNLAGHVYDPLGTGVEDIDRMHVRFVGKPEKRIEEDYLRILRFFRFSAIYGKSFDEEGLAACSKMAHGIDTLSKERITQEFFKIISSDDPVSTLNIMFDNNVLTDLKSDDYDAGFMLAFCGFQKRYRLASAASRHFVFAGMNLDNIKGMGKYILYPKVFIRDMQCIKGALNLSDLDCDASVRACVYRFGRVATAQALLIELTQDRVMNHYAPTALDIIQKWDYPMFPLSGNDLMDAGIEKGPELGKALDALENYWIESDFKLTSDELLAKINAN